MTSDDLALGFKKYVMILCLVWFVTFTIRLFWFVYVLFVFLQSEWTKLEISIYLSIYLSMNLSICHLRVYMCVCMYVCMYIYIYICVYIHAPTKRHFCDLVPGAVRNPSSSPVPSVDASGGRINWVIWWKKLELTIGKNYGNPLETYHGDFIWGYGWDFISIEDIHLDSNGMRTLTCSSVRSRHLMPFRCLRLSIAL